MTHTPEDQNARMMTLEWALDLVRNNAGGAYRADLARAALSLAQWVSADRDPSPALGASPDFDADELPTIEIPGEVYVGGRRADGINPDEDDEDLCGWCDVPVNETHMPDCAGGNLCTDCGHAREIHRSRQWPCQIGCSCSGFRLNP